FCVSWGRVRSYYCGPNAARRSSRSAIHLCLLGVEGAFAITASGPIRLLIPRRAESPVAIFRAATLPTVEPSNRPKSVLSAAPALHQYTACYQDKQKALRKQLSHKALR